ncbi:DUF7019 family protein [Streptomyces clavuligerus]|uniref:Uncharacterized protein n=1 Tax=Streptomyces clavuligerus TaxID=1901 RepID=E2Q1H7_STRCL|nr:SAVMC3_10250 family protein [Streptomyces clavuligerus]ANW16876.1 hypothetical protein BB341_00860 [Streptomyces clavuligerus]AXU11405.1 hypothetical protein D1794_00925 [Streptomyces clavuligerus]EFG10603.1 Hypothetical protein SCLAV_5536 [Streptomyces clavuligerus]MBY6301221.1 hypothetical protein [Streptomyces clavuligerus]QCS04276.1 hypothetical protein CRV15_00925 [Streptomyces clavuligerus]
MRYYLYLSGAKLDMLYGQIPAGLLRRLAVEAKLDLKVVSLAVQSPRAELSVYDRLGLVESYLERESEVSWITDPSSWFRGDLDLQIAGYGRAEGPVFMTGREGDTVVALIGSAHHLVGQRPVPESIPVSHSALPSLFRLLPDRHGEGPAYGGPGEAESLAQVVAFGRGLKEPPVYCEFLARRLLRSTVRGDDGRELEIVIGTPLYVAQGEDEDRGR